MAAEAQASAMAVDELEWAKIFWSTMIDPTKSINTEETLQHSRTSFVITDARSLFDASKSVSAGMHLNERRTAIEVAIVAERVSEMKATWKWVNSDQQVADGLTKPSAKEKFDNVLHRGNHRLLFDPQFTAAKKISKMEKEEQERTLKEAAEQVFGMSEIEDKGGEEQGLCSLVGCNRAIRGASDGHKFCSRRHFYLNNHRREGWRDTWRDAAKTAVAVLMASEIGGADAVSVDGKKESEEGDWQVWVITALVIVLFAGAGMHSVLRMASEFCARLISRSGAAKEVDVNDAVTENDMIPENQAIPDENEASEDSETTEEEAVAENVNARASHGDHEAFRAAWSAAYVKVKHDPRMRNWKLTVDKALNGDYGRHLRDRMLERCSVRYRMEQFAKKNGSLNVAVHQVELWHELCNRNDKSYMRGFIEGQQAEKEEVSRIAASDTRMKATNGDIRDMVIQTEVSYAWHYQSPRFINVPSRTAGAWEHRGVFNERW